MSDEFTVDDFTVETARSAIAAGRGGEWVEAFLASDGSHDAALGEQRRQERTSWWGPTMVAFDRLHRVAGPSDEPMLD
ncbi:MAG: hypothetical protein AAGG08_19825, partial [Actinomycetota bacterium]